MERCPALRTYNRDIGGVVGRGFDAATSTTAAQLTAKARSRPEALTSGPGGRAAMMGVLGFDGDRYRWTACRVGRSR